MTGSDQSGLRESEREAGRLPARGEFVIRGAYVITMDDSLGDVADTDVHVRDGEILTVGKGVAAGSAEVLSGQGMMLLPGFIDTHWHLWNSLMRGLIGHGPGRGYFEVKRGLAPYYRPVDFYRSARLALAEALDSGITTVHNWDHNTRSPADADANVLAQLDSGVRGRFSYGPPDNFPGDRLMDVADLDRFCRQWIGHTDDLLSFGVALRGPFRTEPKVCDREWEVARNNGLPITMHCDRCFREQGCRRCDMEAMVPKGLLGNDVQIVHMVHASDADVAAMAQTGTHLTLSPQTEMRTMGFPKVSEMVSAGVLVSLSIDTTAVPSNADMFSQMRVVLSTEMARVEDTPLNPRRMLRMATLDGARDLGIDDRVGSISPGKRADLILIRMNDLNMVPCADPLDVVVLAGAPHNVDTVIVDGRILKRAGNLVGFDRERLAREVLESTTYLLSQAGWKLPAALSKAAARGHGCAP